ncbi:MAG: UbiA family prenyltransferase [Bdellovibrionales bacterium]|nr:UbiA family prenyltransferase [Bdellovibrionales bacterium]
MIARAIAVFVRISRLDTSLIVFLSLAVPLYLRLHDYRAALGRAFPLLAISMCGFILNDIHDVERDAENHPDRPLPRRQLSQAQAAAIYFVLLAAALVTLRAFVDAPMAALYLLLLIALINYNYVVAYFPYLKNVYAAATGVLPLVILALTLGHAHIAIVTLLALFCFLLGRELLMDVEDLRGDTGTLAKRIGAPPATYAAFALKFLSAFTLLIAAPNGWPVQLAIAILSLDLIFAFAWTRSGLRRAVVHAMKAQLVLGIAYVAVG